MKKIPTLFERHFENHKVIEVLPNITPGCKESFEHGIATIKLDGACCAVIGGKLYKRYDAKNGKPVPKDAIKCQDEPDPITGHLPCWVQCDYNNPADKWFLRAYANAVLHENSCPLPDGTYEAIGPHFQGNPYNLPHDVMERHGLREVNVVRTFDDVKLWLNNFYHEGLVFWLNGEPVCKIKRSDFGLEWGGRKK